jgi:hypothetical protein
MKAIANEDEVPEITGLTAVHLSSKLFDEVDQVVKNIRIQEKHHLALKTNDLRRKSRQNAIG